MIDSEGFRANVGIILINEHEKVLWAQRTGQQAWQFPQGGIQHNETTEQALFRELNEEVGLTQNDVKIIATTKGWLRYRLPKSMVRQSADRVCIGQKQKWFLLKMLAHDAAVKVDNTAEPEFDDWQWVSYWYPLEQVISFKREVYRRAMKELARNLTEIY